MVLVLGSVVARKDALTEALALSLEHVSRSRLEPGCIAHAVHQDVENPQRLVFVEQWTSEADLWRHFKVPASRNFVQLLATLTSEAPSVAIYQAISVAAPGQPSIP